MRIKYEIFFTQLNLTYYPNIPCLKSLSTTLSNPESNSERMLVISDATLQFIKLIILPGNEGQCIRTPSLIPFTNCEKKNNNLTCACFKSITKSLWSGLKYN